MCRCVLYVGWRAATWPRSIVGTRIVLTRCVRPVVGNGHDGSGGDAPRREDRLGKRRASAAVHGRIGWQTAGEAGEERSHGDGELMMRAI